MKSQLVTRESKSFAHVENGGMSVLNLFFLMAVGILAGVAIDVSSLVSARSHLQVTADAAAHAALVEREFESVDDARTKAVSLAEINMPRDRFGEILTTTNIQFGSYDKATKTFSVDNTSRDAVLVKTERLTSNGNPVSSFLLQFAGFWNWDVRTTSVFETFYPTCLIEGFVAEKVIDIQSNNSYFNGFCIHSNSYVTINNNNYFEPGTVVSMPDKDDMVINITGNGEDKNDGLAEALREGKWFIKILNRIDMIKDGLSDRTSRFARSYTSNFSVIDSSSSAMTSMLTGQKHQVRPNDLHKGRIYDFTGCNKVDLMGDNSDSTYSEVVIIADCAVEISGSVVLEDVVILTTYSNPSKASVSSPANIVLGKPDNCAAGGGTQIIAKGDIDFSAGVEMYGSQIISGGNVEFSSNADGLQGASIVAGGRIDSTSNMNFAFCGSGMEHSFLAEYFRLAG